MIEIQHKRIEVVSMFQNGISQNTKCAIRDGFHRDSAKMKTQTFLCSQSIFAGLVCGIAKNILVYLLSNTSAY